MRPISVHLPGFYVAGQTVRTTNQNETQAVNGKDSRAVVGFFRYLTRPAGIRGLFQLRFRRQRAV